MDSKLLNIKLLEDLERLPPDMFDQQLLTEAEVSHIFKLCEALWLHDGNPKRPHALLTSGKHSDGFVDTLKVLRHTNLCRMLAQQLVLRLQAQRVVGEEPSPNYWVIGSDHAGATLSYQVAALLGAQHDFTEKGPDKTQCWRRQIIEHDEPVLQVEELITTSQTVQAVREGIIQGNPVSVGFFPAIATLVFRPDDNFVNPYGCSVIFVVHYEIKTWSAEKCPLCQQGSMAIRPKERNNWARLTALVVD